MKPLVVTKTPVVPWAIVTRSEVSEIPELWFSVMRSAKRLVPSAGKDISPRVTSNFMSSTTVDIEPQSSRKERISVTSSSSRVVVWVATSTSSVVPEVKVHDSDVVLARLHGLSPFSGTELDFVLRNLDVTTVVAVGVSVNIAIQNLTFDCVNAGYQVVIPVDAVAGTPRSYVEQVFEHTLRNVATLVTTDDLLRAWSAAG